jgi:hypothetical protein
VSWTGDFGVGKGNKNEKKKEMETERQKETENLYVYNNLLLSSKATGCVNSEFFLNATRAIYPFIKCK